MTEMTGMVKVTVGDAELHAGQTATVVVKPAGSPELGAWAKPELEGMTTVVV